MSGNSDFSLERRKPKAFPVEGDGPLMVDIETSIGVISCRLLERRVPVTVWNFAGLAMGKVTGTPYYEGLIFHRVIPEFLIHGGCPDGDGTGGPGAEYAIPIEEDVENKHDRPGLLTQLYIHRDKGGSQFMITEEAAPWLNRNHTIFGEVSSGMDVVKQIARGRADSKNRPADPVTIDKVFIYRGKRKR